jgi:hypothetical protein
VTTEKVVALLMYKRKFKMGTRKRRRTTTILIGKGAMISTIIIMDIVRQISDSSKPMVVLAVRHHRPISIIDTRTNTRKWEASQISRRTTRLEKELFLIH